MLADYFPHILALVISLFCTGFLVLGGLRKHPVGIDSGHGPQKIHQGLVPRIGGVSIFVSLLFYYAFSVRQSALLPILLISAAPIFIAGFIEDITGKVSAWKRLLMSIITGLAFCFLSGYSITSAGVDSVQHIFSTPSISIALTVISIAGLANAVNIIDGLNGLASGVSIFIAVCFAAVSMMVGDAEILMISLALVASLVGFFIWNYPLGRIFLGDGGAYLLGAVLAGIAVLLPERNASISPFFSLLIVVYPMYELLRSVARRVTSNWAGAFLPDNKHLHSLVFRTVAAKVSFSPKFQNSLAASIVLLVPLGTSIWAVMHFNDRGQLIAGILVFVVVYEIAVMFFARQCGRNAA